MRLLSRTGIPRLALALGLWLFGQLASASAQTPAVEGQFISVKNPITSEVVNRVKETAKRFIDRVRATDDPNNRRAIKIVYDFNSGNSPANSDDDACLGLAREILQQQDITTIAFVHGEVSRLSVLPVLACRQIVLSAEAKLGPVAAGGEAALPPEHRAAFDKVIEGRSLYPAIVHKLFDRDLEVLEARSLKDGSPYYIDARRIDVEKANGYVVVNPNRPAVPRGVSSYTAAEANRFGLSQRTLNDRLAVAHEYGLPPRSLRDSLASAPVAVRLILTGTFSKGEYDSAVRRIRNSVAKGGRHANTLIVQLDCGGGDLAVAQDFANYLRELKQDDGVSPVMTIAYVPHTAPDTAAVIALGCNEIVMGKNADFGDFSRAFPSTADGEPAKKLAVEGIRGLAVEQGYDPLLVEGMFDRNLTIYEAKSRTGASRWQLMTEAQLNADLRSDKPQWEKRRLVKAGGPEGQLLVLKADLAKELKLATHVVEDHHELYAACGLSDDKVTTLGSDLLDDLAYFLRLPLVTVLLFMIGTICLILEFKIPGVTLPGIIAVVCFLLFFWAHSQFNGQVTMLAVLLFLLGLILIGVEVFVLPGFGVTGISGLILVLVSLTLVTLAKRPETTKDWLEVGSTMMMFAGSLIGSVIGSMAIMYYLPSIPYANRLILKPAGGEDGEGDATQGFANPELAELLGAIGVAATPLRPAGKVKIGSEFVDVVAESYINAGTRVQVIEIEGNRVVVKEV